MSDRYPIIAGAEPWSSPGKGERASLAVVVSHGFTGNPTSVRPLGEALAREGFAVELIRLPGHGTHWRDMQRTRYADWRGEVERALDALRRAGKRVLLVGLSLGGTLVLDVAASRSDDVAGVVAINAAVLDREGLVVRLAPLLETLLPVVPAGAAGLVKNDAAKPGVDERAYAWVPTKAGNSTLKELPRIRAALANLRAPALIAYSPQDHSVPAQNSRAILRMLEGKRATELVLERSYHLATLDYDADLLAERVIQFASALVRPESAARLE